MEKTGNCLAVLWLGLSAFTAVAQVQSLVRELKCRMVRSKKRERERRQKYKVGAKKSLVMHTSSIKCLLFVKMEIVYQQRNIQKSEIQEQQLFGWASFKSMGSFWYLHSL